MVRQARVRLARFLVAVARLVLGNEAEASEEDGDEVSPAGPPATISPEGLAMLVRPKVEKAVEPAMDEPLEGSVAARFRRSR